MVVFPQSPRATTVELFVNSGWVDITSDVYARDSLHISRGRRDEQTRAEPQSCLMTVNNRSGNYSPRNPAGAYYGSLGRNTPIRVNIGIVTDMFTRTVANGWGVADTGHTYSLTGSGGTVQNSDFSVSGGVGRLSVPVTNGIRTAMVNGLSFQDIDISGFTTLPFTDVTGAPIYPVFVRLRQYSTTDYVYAFVRVEVTEAITVGIAHSSGLVIVADTTAAGVGAFTSAVGVRWRAQAEGQTWRIKAWLGNASEPYGWSGVGHFAASLTAGSIGLSAWVVTGNTNTLPVVSQIDSLSVRVPRFFGEVSSWPQRWDVSGNDIYVPIAASGIKRRLGQGAAPLRSALYRWHARLAIPPVGYWSAEDPKHSPQQFASAVGGYPMAPAGAPGPLGLSSYTDLLSSSPLVVLAPSLFDPTNKKPTAAFCNGAIVPYTSTGSTMARCIVFIPLDVFDESTFTGGFLEAGIFSIFCTGTSQFWAVMYAPNATLKVQAGTGTPFFDSGVINFPDIRGRQLLLSLQLTESGSDVLWDVSVLEVGAATGLHFGGTVAGKTVGQASSMQIDGSRLLVNTAFGHMSVRPETSGFGDIADGPNDYSGGALNGYNGEPAGSRMFRLCTEEGFPFTYRGDLTTTVVMGPQGANAVASGTSTSGASLTLPSTGQTLLDLLYECEDADLGILYEPRGDFGLEYRTRTDLYTRTPTLTLDYSQGHVAPPLEPVDDDQKTRNNVIVTRVNGQSAEAELTTGRLSTRDPAAGGVGRYNAQYTVNVASDNQLAELAEFGLILGTPDEARYPTISVQLANPNVQAAGLEAAVLAVNIGDRIQVVNPKTGVTSDPISQIVQGYTEMIDTFSHVVTFNCTPESPYHIVQLDGVDDFRIDTATSTLVSGVSSSATTMSVANTSEPWTTDPAQMPIPIVVAGEQMNVTAVSGTSSPQTFTVTRSVNRVVTSQLAGAAVRVYPPSSPSLGL